MLFKSRPKSSKSKIKLISKRELQRHDRIGDLWIAVNGFVYDVSDFQHPGGKDKLVSRGGTDCSKDFNAVGHKNADQHLDRLKVGRYFDNENYPKEEQDSDVTKYLLYGGVALVLAIVGYKIFTAKD